MDTVVVVTLVLVVIGVVVSHAKRTCGPAGDLEMRSLRIFMDSLAADQANRPTTGLTFSGVPETLPMMTTWQLN